MQTRSTTSPITFSIDEMPTISNYYNTRLASGTIQRVYYGDIKTSVNTNYMFEKQVPVQLRRSPRLNK